eukprot:4373109-Amphidinium_carterae.1
MLLKPVKATSSILRSVHWNRSTSVKRCTKAGKISTFGEIYNLYSGSMRVHMATEHGSNHKGLKGY